MFPTCQDPVNDNFQVKGVADELSATTHSGSSQKPFKHGTITCQESIIVSSMGHNIVIREIQSGALVPAIVNHYHVNHF